MENKNIEIKIASKNPVKVDALTEIIKDYDYLKDAKVVSMDVMSQVDEQPKSLEETIKGSINRAKNGYIDCDYSFGIESGLMAVPNTNSGYMDVCVCAIFNGKDCYIGLSSAWEVPKPIADHVINNGLDLNEASYKEGLTSNPTVGSAEGLVGILTKSRLTRKGYTKEAIRMALIHLNI